MTTDYKEKIGELTGIEVIEKNGIDVEKLRKLLLAGVGAEFLHIITIQFSECIVLVEMVKALKKLSRMLE